MARRCLLQQIVHEALIRLAATRSDRAYAFEKVRVDSKRYRDLRGIADRRAADAPHGPELLVRKRGNVRVINVTVADRAIFGAFAPSDRWSSRPAR